MPIEIKELHIRVAVTPPAGAAAAASGAKASGEDRDAMVAECVEQVMTILQNKMER